MNLSRSLLTLLLSAHLLTPLGARATPDYFTGQLDAPVADVGTSGITATFSGGQTLYRTFTFINGSTPIYGTTSQVPGYTNQLTINFSQPVSNVNILIFNLSGNATTLTSSAGASTTVSSFGTKKINLAVAATTSVSISVQDKDATDQPVPGWSYAIVTNIATDQGAIQFQGTPPPLPTGTTVAQIAASLEAAPGSTGTFSVFQTQPAISGNAVVFNALDSGGGRGIYTGSGGATTLVANFNTPVPNGSGNFSGFGNVPAISGGTVVFRGGGSAGSGIYTSSAGTLAVVADPATPIPGGSGNFTLFPSDAAISGARIAFQGNGASSQGVYLSAGGSLSVVADTSTAIPGGTGSFQAFGIPTVSGASVVFPGTGADPLGGTDLQLGIYRFTGGALTTIADKNTPIPGGTGNFTSFGGAAVSGTNVAFLGKGANGQVGIYLFSNGALTLIANGGTPIPDGGLTFSSFSAPAISGSVVVFQGGGPWLQSGLYASQAGVLQKLVGANEPAPGNLTLAPLQFGTLGFDGASVAFECLLNGNSPLRAVFRADVPAFVPDATTGAASQITRGSAQVEGTVASGGAETTVTVKYDTDISDDDYDFSQTIGPTTATDAATLSTTLTGLTPGSLYHYRILATNSAGSVSGLDATFTTSPNKAPLAEDDLATTAFQTAVDIDVVANDQDDDNDPLSGILVTSPAHGGVTPIMTGNRVTGFRYTPADGFTGEDSFTYRDSDGFAFSNTAKVTVSVGPAPIVDPVRTVLFTGGGGVPGAGALGSGVPDGAVWAGFGPPSIDSAGKVAFLGQWKAPGGPGAGIFFDGVLVAKSGDPSPGPGSSHLGVLRDPVLDSGGSGAVAFLATLTGADRAHDTIAISNARTDGQPGVGRLHVVAAEGEVAPGTQGARFALLSGLSLHGADVAVSATLVVGTGAPRVTTASNRGVWIYPGNGHLPFVVRNGASFDGKTIRSFDALQATRGSLGAGRGEQLDFGGEPALGFTARFTDGSQAQCLEAADAGSAVAESGISGLKGGETFASFGPLAIFVNPALALGFRATLTHGVGGVASADDEGVFFAKSGDQSFTAVARKGQTVGESGGASFSSFLDPVLNSDGAIAFQARLRVPGAAVAYDDSVFYAPPGGSARLLARERGQPPEAPAGAQWGSFLSLAFPDHAAGPLILAQLINHYYNGYTNGHLRPGPGGVTMTTDIGLWGMGAGGDLRLLLREGDLLNGKKVSTFTVLSTVLGSPGVTHSYNNAQDVVLRVFFADRTQGIVRIQLPNVPQQ